MVEKRQSKRFTTHLKARYFREAQREDRTACTVINISRNGAGLEFYTSDDIDINTTITLELLLPGVANTIAIRGIVRWLRQGKKDSIGGMEVVSAEDKERLGELVDLIQG